MKNVLLLPRWMASLSLYRNNGGDFNICLGKLDAATLSAKYIVGFSLGALIALRDIENIEGKLILINPLVPKRSLAKWFIQWAKFILNEGLFLKRQRFTINPIRYITGLIDCVQLLAIDFSGTLDNISQNKITVIRGKNDTFFCDDIALEFLRSKNIKIIEVAGGHNWNEEMENALNNLFTM